MPQYCPFRVLPAAWTQHDSCHQLKRLQESILHSSQALDCSVMQYLGGRLFSVTGCVRSSIDRMT